MSLEPLEMVPRDSWEAVAQREPPKALDMPLTHVVVHWGTDTDPCETTEECTTIMKNIQKSHMEQMGFEDIAYNFVIGGDGKAYVGRGWEGAPSPLIFPEHEPTKRIDIAYIGRDWNRGNIPWEMLKAALQVLSAGVDNKQLQEDYITPEYPEPNDEDDEE